MELGDKTIREYFKNNFIFFRYLWAKGDSLAMHLGFWDENTKNKAQALINENLFVYEKLDVNDGQNVLDVGCGMGGTSIWIARQNDVRITGLDFVEENIDIAKKFSIKKGVADRTNFIVGDFLEIDAVNQYDRIFSIEGYSYAVDKKALMEKCVNSLKDGGKIVIADYFKDENINEADSDILRKWCNAWSYPGLASIQDVIEYIDNIHCDVDVNYIDVSEKIIPSSMILNKISKRTYPLLKIMKRLQILNDLPEKTAIDNEVRLFSDGVIKYYVITIDKRAGCV